MMLEQIDFPNRCSSERIRPLMGPDNRRHFEGLAHNRLLLPRCDRCATMRPPAGAICPECAAPEATWAECTGLGTVHSWACYHRAFIDEFQPLIPYYVLLVRLDEGPILPGRLHGGFLADQDMYALSGQRVIARSERWSDGFCGLAFEIFRRNGP